MNGRATGPGSAGAADLSARWIHGSPDPRHRTDPPLQVHRVDPDTYLLRESKDVSFEAPFLYLAIGRERALLLDTGATAEPSRFPVRSTVDRLLEGREVDLFVAHTHGHGDHVAGDAQFADRPRCRVVPRDRESVRREFGFSGDLDEVRTLELGDRAFDLVQIPGHHAASVAFFDRRLGLLHTGDTVYPGRLYVDDMPAFLASLERLVRFAEAHPVTVLLGCHVEMADRPFAEFPFAAKFQPGEASPVMPVARLREVLEAARTISDRPGRHAFSTFTIFNGPSTGAALRTIVRGRVWNLRYRLGLLRGSA